MEGAGRWILGSSLLFHMIIGTNSTPFSAVSRTSRDDNDPWRHSGGMESKTSQEEYPDLGESAIVSYHFWLDPKAI